MGALTYFGADGIAVADKDSMRELALRGGPWTDAERRALLAYCESDVVGLERLVPHLVANLAAGDLGRALLRGRYMVAAARIEATGVPIDTEALETLRAGWDAIKARLVERVDRSFGVFDGLTFKSDRWARWLGSRGIAWPYLESGALALDDDTFREMARAHPEVAPVRELRHALGQLRLNDLAVGADGRNRALLSAFRARTGRNQPSNTAFVFGPSVWLRGLIRPEPGCGLVYLDWSQQEFGIAAALSGDGQMRDAYLSGDPYLSFAKQAGAVPASATKKTHGAVREQFKSCVLAVQYGMGPGSLAGRIGQPPIRARELLRLHREAYPVFWRWSDAAVDTAMLHGQLSTVFGWTVRTGPEANGRSLRNFPMQANGAEMLRLACCFATERGIRVCAPVHDALLVEAPAAELGDVVAETQRAMRDASATVLGGFALRSDAKVIRSPERYSDERGIAMWDSVWALLAEDGRLSRSRDTVVPPASTCPVSCL